MLTNPTRSRISPTGVLLLIKKFMFRNPCVKRIPPRSTKYLVSVPQAYWNTEFWTKHEVPPRERRTGSESDPRAAAGLGPVRGLSTRGQSGLQGGGASQAFAAWEAHFSLGPRLQNQKVWAGTLLLRLWKSLLTCERKMKEPRRFKTQRIVAHFPCAGYSICTMSMLPKHPPASCWSTVGSVHPGSIVSVSGGIPESLPSWPTGHAGQSRGWRHFILPGTWEGGLLPSVQSPP